jgi:hypothetical protein
MFSVGLVIRTPPDANPKFRVSIGVRIECWSQEKEDRCDREKEREDLKHGDRHNDTFYFKSWVGEVGGMHRIKPFDKRYENARDAGKHARMEKRS